MRVLFVCTGNLCRSPMAEAIARARHGAVDAVTFASAGLRALEGRPATPMAVAAASERDADASGHRSTQVTRRRLEEADLIYVMTAEHLDGVLGIAPGVAGRAALLDPSGRDIDDPIGGTLDDYREAGDHIASAIEARLAEWA